MSRRVLHGFTLLEVMVAVVILAVGLSSLFTSEAGAIRIAQRARTTTIASLLARCKMAEVEERILKEGWPGTQLDGRDECCEGAEQDGFRCEYKVERIVLPDQMGGDEESKDALKELANNADSTKQGGDPAAPGADPTSALGVPLNGPLGALGGLMGGGMGGGDSGGGDPMASMVMEFTFPIMKPLIEEQVRRATVTVSWTEGSAEQTLDVVQFLVNELPMVVDEDEDAPDPNAPPGTDPNATGAAGTGTKTETGTQGNTTPGGLKP